MAKCPICSTYVKDTHFVEKYVSPFNNQEYKLYHCPNCDLQWWEPLKIIPEFYENETFEMYKFFHLGIRKKLPPYQEYFFKYIPIKKGRLLDIGCGDGLFLEYAKKFGFEVYGIDFDKNSVKIAKQKLKSNKVYAMSLDNFIDFAKQKKLQFDVITFFEVLEHQDNPKQFLSNVKKLLAPKGFIAGSVPNRDSFFNIQEYQILMKNDYPPHHFLRFSKKALFNTLKFEGFSDIYITATHYNVKDIPNFVEKKFFPFIQKIKGKIKAQVVEKDYAPYLEVKRLAEYGKKGKLLYPLINLANNMRKALLFLIGIPFILKIHNNGISFYFQARILNKYE